MNTPTALDLLSNVIFVENKASGACDDYPTLTASQNPNINTPTHSWRLLYNNAPQEKLNNYRVCYKCLTCLRQSVIGLNHLAKKMNRNSQTCETCHSFPHCSGSLKNYFERPDSFLGKMSKDGKVKDL